MTIRKSILAAIFGLVLVAAVSTGFKYQDFGRWLDVSFPFLLAEAQGHVDDWGHNRKFGFNNDLGATWEPIHESSEATYSWPDHADVLNIVSGSADDSGVAGTAAGAHTITIIGLDGDLNEITETVTLQGQTIVSTTNQFYRVNRAFVASGGTDLDNAGAISIDTAVDSDTVAVIPAGEGQTLQAVYTVPAGYTGYIKRFAISAASNKVVDFRVRIRLNADDTAVPYPHFRTILRESGISGPVELVNDGYEAFPEKTDIIVEGQGASNPAASAAFNIHLKAN